MGSGSGEAQAAVWGAPPGGGLELLQDYGIVTTVNIQPDGQKPRQNLETFYLAELKKPQHGLHWLLSILKTAYGP